MLLKYDLPVLETEIVLNEEQLLLAVEKIGFPLVLKVFSTSVLHRTEKGLLRTGLQNLAETKRAFEELLSASKNDQAFEGILVQKQVKGVELFCGLKQDKTFGHVLMFGLGGIFVEVLKDIVFGLCPLSQKEALDLISSIKGRKILDGFRGMPALDKNGLAEVLVKLSVLISENPQIKEADFNPIIVSGKDIFIVDAKMTEGRPPSF